MEGDLANIFISPNHIRTTLYPNVPVHLELDPHAASFHVVPIMGESHPLGSGPNGEHFGTEVPSNASASTSVSTSLELLPRMLRNYRVIDCLEHDSMQGKNEHIPSKSSWAGTARFAKDRHYCLLPDNESRELSLGTSGWSDTILSVVCIASAMPYLNLPYSGAWLRNHPMIMNDTEALTYTPSMSEHNMIGPQKQHSPCRLRVFQGRWRV